MKKKLSHYLIDPIWNNNQVLSSVLGICSALAVTSKLSIAMTMGISVSLVTAFSSAMISLLRNVTPNSIRMILQLSVISTFVIIVDEFLKAYFFEISKTLSVFVGLIITNCIVMGRAESMAKNHPPLPAFLDGLGAGLGYSWVLFIIASIRETLGFGTFFGIKIVPKWIYASAEFPDRYSNFSFFTLPASSFFIVGTLIWIVNTVVSKKGDK